MISKSQAETEVSFHLEKSSLEGWMRRLGSRTACDRCRVPLDKSEGSVKGKDILCSAGCPRFRVHRNLGVYVKNKSSGLTKGRSANIFEGVGNLSRSHTVPAPTFQKTKRGAPAALPGAPGWSIADGY